MNNSSTKPFIFLLILFLGFAKASWSQQLVTELNAKLSSSDQQKLQKADELFAKGLKIEEDLKSANKEERKSQLKRLEAADYYQNANSKKEKVFNDNSSSFWKKYTGEKKLLEFVKKVEVAAADSFKKASGFRNSAEKELKLSDRIAWLTKAENTEKRALIMMQKVVYTYLSWPIDYDHSWVSTDDLKLPNESKKAAKETLPSQQIPTKSNTETTQIVKKDTITRKDTTTRVTNQGRPRTNMIIVKPRSTPVVSAETSVKSGSRDTLKSSALPVQKPIVTEPSKAKDTTKAVVVPTSKTPAAPVSVTLPSVTVTDKAVKTNVADTSKKQKQQITDKGKSKTIKPAQKDSTKTAATKVKAKEVVVGNDSSLYGKVKVKEDQIDKFNDFLKQKYPSKVEDYVINFQELDYSDIESLKQAWYRYQYGYLSQDSAALVASLADSTAKTQKIAQATDNKTSDATGKQKTKQSVKESKKVTTPVTPVVAVTKPDKGKTKQSRTEVNRNAVEENFVPTTEGFIFRVQIVACRVRLDEKTLKGIYDGSLTIMELHEDNWYKYAIGEFGTYKEARKLRDQSKIPGVFVIAYLNGKRIKITPAIAYKKFVPQSVPASLKAELIKYRIQIASSKTLLSDNYIKNIYSGPEKIEILKESGWNKYMLTAGKTYKEASELLKKISVPGAFIVAYQQDTRIELQSAIKITQ